MVRKHEVAIASDTRAFEMGVKSGVVEPLEDAEKALKDLGKVDVGRDVEKDLKIAERATKDLKDETQEAADAISKQFRESYRKIKDDSQDATTKMKDGFQEAKEEANSSGREAAASFGGGFDDVADFVQETLANALSGFGPVGAAAGLALAAVMGTALASSAAAQEKLNEAREAAVDLASTLYENKGKLPIEEQVESLFTVLGREAKANGVLQKMVDDWTDYGSVLDDVRDVAERTGRPLSELIKGLQPGDIAATQAELAKVNEELAKLNPDWTPVWDEQYQSLTTYKTELEATAKAQQDAQDLNDALGDTGRIDALTQAWSNAGVAIEDYLTAGEDGGFDVAAYVADMEAQIAKADEVKKDLLTIPQDIRAEAERIWSEQGVAGADAYIDGYQGADAATKAKLEAIAGPQGQAAGRAAAEGFITNANSRLNQYDPADIEAKLRVAIDTSAWDNWRPATKTSVVKALTTVATMQWGG